MALARRRRLVRDVTAVVPIGSWKGVTGSATVVGISVATVAFRGVGRIFRRGKLPRELQEKVCEPMPCPEGVHSTIPSVGRARSQSFPFQKVALFRGTILNTA